MRAFVLLSIIFTLFPSLPLPALGGEKPSNDPLALSRENNRIVDPSSALGVEFNAFAHDVFKKVYQPKSSPPENVTFWLMESDAPHAAALMKSKPKIIILSTGLLRSLTTLEGFAWFMGHEWTHHRVHDKLGAGYNAKSEEYLADAAPMEALHLAGLNVREIPGMWRAVYEKFPKEPFIVRLLDEHGTNENREKVFTNIVGALHVKYGKLDRQSTPLPPRIIEMAREAKHVSALDIKIKNIGLAPALKETLLTAGAEHTARHEDFVKQIDALASEPNAREHAAFFDELATIALKRVEERPKEDTSDFAEKLYARIGFAWKKAMGIKTIGRPPIGRLRHLDGLARRFISAHDSGEAQRAAMAFVQGLDAEPLGSSFLTTIEWANFSLPDEDEVQENAKLARKDPAVRRIEAPWNRFLAWGKQDGSQSIIRALLALGLVDPRLDQLVTPEIALEIYGANFKALSPGPRTKKYGARDLRLNEHGHVLGYHRSSAHFEQSNAARRRAETFLSTVLSLFESGMRGDENAEKTLRSILEHRNSSVIFPNKILGIDLLDANPDLFVYFNVANAWGGMYSNKRSILISETTKVRDKLVQMARSPEKSAVFKKLFFPAQQDRTRAFPELFRLELQVESKYTLPELVLWQFLRKEGREVLPADERIRLIKEHKPTDRFFMEKKKLFREADVQFIREIAGYEEPRNVPGLFSLLGYSPELSESPVFLMELVILLPRLDPKAGELEGLWQHLPASDIGSFPEVLKAFWNYSDRMKWPVDLERRIAQFKVIERKGLFNDNNKTRFRVLKTIIASLKKEKNIDRKIAHLEMLLDGRRIAEPALREQIFSLWLDAIKAKYGLDTGEEQYRAAIESLINRVKTKIQLIDRIELFSRLASVLQTQGASSIAFKDALIPSTRDALATGDKRILLGEGLIEVVRKYPKERLPLFVILTSTLTETSVNEFLDHILQESDLTRELIDEISVCGDIDRTENEEPFSPSTRRLREMLRPAVSLMHENFWASPFSARTVVLDGILFPEANPSETAFDGIKDFAFGRLFPVTEKYSKEARLIISRYLSLVPSYQKTLMLSAMLVSAVKDEKGASDEFNIGERLASMLELMGPAETKFGQGAHSHEALPADVRQGMKRLKSLVDPPFRWDMIDLYETRLPESIRNRVVHIRGLLGAAAYFVVFEVDYRTDSGAIEPRVIALLRPNALERAENGFELLTQLGQELESVGEISSTAFKEIAENARAMAKIETDSALSAAQYDAASKIYDGMNISVNGRKFTFKAVELDAWGEGYRVMKKAAGIHFNDLPEDTPQELAYKSDLALAHLALELHALLRGGRFDHDRHGAQLRIDGENVTLFDFGAMALEPPTPEQRQLLGKALAELLEASSQHPDLPITTLFQKIREKAPENLGLRQYFRTIERSLLAWSDFIRYAPPEGLQRVLAAVFAAGEIHQDIAIGFFERSSPEAFARFTSAGGCERYLTEASIVIRRTR